MALEHHGYKIWLLYLCKQEILVVTKLADVRSPSCRCEMSHLLADRCSRHIQSVFNLIMDIHVMVN